MIRINLLPFRSVRKKEAARRQLTIFVGSLVFVLAMASGYSYFLSAKNKNLNEKIRNARIEIQQYNQINSEIAEIKVQLDVLSQKINIAQSFEAARTAPVELLRDISGQIVKKQMWITRIDEMAENVRISGIALDNPAIAEYMTRLQSLPNYTDVKLESIQQDTSIRGLSLKRFNISFHQVAQAADNPKWVLENESGNGIIH
ncbi:PilN domain-containing protein [Desulfosarcina sp. OttesenSCG-928-G17]|nr:PilN domain-containing protein [Desulfosarcina sp. OttesenSCG-928-G17]